MKPFFILIPLLCLVGCMTVGQKRIPISDVDTNTAAVFVQTNEKMYKQNEYLTFSPIVKEDPLFNSELIISTENLQLHKSTTDKLLGSNTFLKQHGNAPIKGTGINLLGFSLSSSVIIIIILCILFPSVTSFLWLTLRRLRRNLKTIVDTIEASSEDETKSEIKTKLSKKMDSSDKRIIAQIKHT